MLRAVIFDLDGVLAESEHLHYAAIQMTLGELGTELTPELYAARYLTFDDHTGIRTFFADRGETLSRERLEELVRCKAEHYEQMLQAGGVRLFPGAAELVAALAPQLPLAVATGSRRVEAEAILRQHGLLSWFTALVSADDVVKGKPDPESFLKALALINQACAPEILIQPQECVVIEDSRLSVPAVRRIGMQCVAVTTSYPAAEFPEASLILPDLAAVNLELLEGLFAQGAGRMMA